ncbi:hypothetical protein [Sphingobacterium hotanense]|uniref:Uncharacterized protein n=1 Tax=Sphingobacterium hotanense TaxID=649196 RepID=A0ABT7NQV4_9SPHI|nr:hypothetical protein [Sphingobacterium hotanense]MDM1049501.1 hypothetical protein [Sphingobacterium hotanense]
MEKTVFQLTLQDLTAVVNSIIAKDKIDITLSKPQLSRLEAERLYGEQRIKKWIKAGLLKPVSQNGKNSRIYFSHKKIIDLSQKSFHHLNHLDY